MVEDLVQRLRKRAEIRRQITTRKSVQNNEPDRISDLLEEAADQLAKYKQALESIANEQVELSHDKIKWQNEDHIKWAKEALK
jgi:proline racemase